MQRAPSCRQYSNSPRLWEPRRTDQMVIQNYTQSIQRSGLGQGRQVAIDSYNLVQGEVLVGGKLYSIHMRADTGRATRSLRRVRSVTFFFFRFEVEENLLDLVSPSFMKCHFFFFFSAQTLWYIFGDIGFVSVCSKKQSKCSAVLCVNSRIF